MEMEIIITHHQDASIIERLRSVISGITGNAFSSSAIRVSSDGWYQGHSEVEWYRNEDLGRGNYLFYDARTQMNEILTWLGHAPPQPAVQPAANTSSSAPPRIKDCVVIIHNSRTAKSILGEIISSINGRVEQHINWDNPIGSLFLSEDVDKIEWNRDLGEWFRNNEPYRSMPVFDLLESVQGLKDHFGIVEGEEESMAKAKKKTKPTEKAPEKPTPRDCFIEFSNDEESELLQEILFEAGHTWDKRLARKYKNLGVYKMIVCGKLYIDDAQETLRYAHPDKSTYQVTRKDWPWFVFGKDLEKIYKFFGVKPKPLTIDRLVRPGLLNMIRSTPGDDLVAGFIRRDLQLVLPQEVQVKGSSEIESWILEQKKGSIPTVVPKPEPSRIFKITIREVVTLREIITRYDDVTIEAEVPQEIIDMAVNDEEDDPIEQWLIEHRRDFEVGRSEYDSEVTHSEEVERSPGDVLNTYNLLERIEELQDNQ